MSDFILVETIQRGFSWSGIKRYLESTGERVHLIDYKTSRVMAGLVPSEWNGQTRRIYLDEDGKRV